MSCISQDINSNRNGSYCRISQRNFLHCNRRFKNSAVSQGATQMPLKGHSEWAGPWLTTYCSSMGGKRLLLFFLLSTRLPALGHKLSSSFPYEVLKWKGKMEEISCTNVIQTSTKLVGVLCLDFFKKVDLKIRHWFLGPSSNRIKEMVLNEAILFQMYI